MMIVMLTPSLAFAMPLCTPAAKVIPCHEGMQATDADHKMGSGKLMLVKDCAGIDLQTVQATILDAPDMSGRSDIARDGAHCDRTTASFGRCASAPFLADSQ